MDKLDLIKWYHLTTTNNPTKFNKNSSIIYSTAENNTTIMSWNIHKHTNVYCEDRLDEQLDYIKTCNSEIVCLQEVTKYKYVKNKLSDSYPYSYYAKADYDLYNMIISKKPLLEPKSYILPGIEFGKRCVIITRVNINNKQIVVANLHLDVFDKTGRTRELQADFIINLLNNFKKPIFLVGDFNEIDPSNMLLYKLLEIRYSDKIRGHSTNYNTLNIFRKAGFKDTFSNPPNYTVWSNRRIDFILSKGYKTMIIPSIHYINLSDHLPIFASLY